MGIAIDGCRRLLAGHLDRLAEAGLEELGEPSGRILAGRRLGGRTKGHTGSRGCRLGRGRRSCGTGGKRRLRGRNRVRRLRRSGKRRSSGGCSDRRRAETGRPLGCGRPGCRRRNCGTRSRRRHCGLGLSGRRLVPRSAIAVGGNVGRDVLVAVVHVVGHKLKGRRIVNGSHRLKRRRSGPIPGGRCRCGGGGLRHASKCRKVGVPGSRHRLRCCRLGCGRGLAGLRHAGKCGQSSVLRRRNRGSRLSDSCGLLGHARKGGQGDIARRRGGRLPGLGAE